MLDKERVVEQLAKVYKETNKECEEWRASVQRQRNKKQKRVTMVIIQKYTHKWMTRRVYLKLLSTTIFIQCCCRQLRARKELQRLKQEAKVLCIKPIGDFRMNLIEERGNDTIWAMKKQLNSDSDVNYTTIQFHSNRYNSQSDHWIGLKF
jgi:myosin heavy subunit